MAIVSSPLQFSGGKLQHLSFYKDRSGRCIARTKRGHIEDFYTNPRYHRTRVSCTEFSSTSQATARLKQPFKPEIKWCSEGTYHNRLLALLRLMQNTDTSQGYGSRHSFRGNANLLRGFEFNKKRPLTEVLNAEYTSTIDPATGQMSVTIDSFIPALALKAPEGARYCHIFIRGASVHETEEYSTAHAVSRLIDLDCNETGTIDLHLQLKPRENDLQVLTLGILFYIDIDDVPVPIRESSMAIVDAQRNDPAARGAKSELHKRPQNIEAMLIQLGSGFRKPFDIPDPFQIRNDPAWADRYREGMERLTHKTWVKQLKKYRGG